MIPDWRRRQSHLRPATSRLQRVSPCCKYCDELNVLAWKLRNKDRVRAYNRAYRAAHKEQNRIQVRAYRARRKERLNAQISKPEATA